MKKNYSTNSEKKVANTTYNMDIKINSYNYTHTSAQWAMGLPFQIESFGHFFACDEYFTEREKLSSYLLIYTRNGRGSIFYEDNELNATKNTVVLINCMKYQYYKTNSQDCWEFMWLHISGTAISYYCNLINEDQANVIDVGENAEVDNVFNKIYLLTKTVSDNADIKFSNYITALLTEIILCKKRNTREFKYLSHKNEILKAIETIRRNYSNKISVEQLASDSHLSKYYFGRIFKEFTGQSPYEFIIFCRINESKNLLTSTELSISEISAKSGFEDTSNFIRYFKKYTGATPGAFRKVKVFGQ